MVKSRVLSLLAASVAALGLLIAAVFAFRSTGAEMFIPRAHSYLFNQRLMLLHGGSDLLIGLASVAISGTLTYLVLRARRELPFHWIMLALAVFIIACGATHFMEVVTLRNPHPPYWLSGWAKLLTAVASMTTAVLLPPLIPKVLGVLQSVRLATDRKTELEKAYGELGELYREVTKTRDLLRAELDSQSRDLAQLAGEVSVRARELEKAKNEAEAANRAKDQFLAVLSHELRTPLTPALAAAANLESSPNVEPAELRESLAMIHRNIELEARLVDDLLDLTRISKGKLEIHSSTINLHETLEHAAEMCRSEAQNRQLALNFHLEAPDHHVLGDGARLAQVFWNLMLNAAKFTPANGRIDVRTTNPAPGRISIEVSDTGIGIEPEMLSQIFEPFWQAGESTTRRFGGLGLGLSVAKGLVDAHRGTITARSDGKDRGASFLIKLPTTIPPAATVVPPASAPAQRQRSLRILLVEDHEDTRQVLRRLLTRWGHVVTTAATVAQAVELAAQCDPELLLSDVGLPDGTGMELLGKLVPDHKIPAIAMSGYGMEEDLEQTRHAGFIEHLTKPISADRLKNAIDRLVLS